MRITTRILGIDPGLRRTGWGLIEANGNRLAYRGCGVIKPPTEGPLAQRLLFLHKALTDLINEHTPDEAAVEETFVNAGARSALLLGQARGVALMTPAALGLPVGEYAANLIKKSVVGTGHADKKQVMMMVKTLLPAAEIGSEDAADALAIAVCHAHFRETPAARLGRAS
ncbi:crossover junction endodeoxyribonuclease RuvC [Cucumibacter marinus]|uniref:crossover junction endodeoxyribonuclease RuvC n=1 Tax=Cucumibacter marinus TaxID=1121252 RepID=UPI00040C53D8|nr:crossover junction endodeoxyribonuclease RuvC [Cucumibacter marinus]